MEERRRCLTHDKFSRPQIISISVDIERYSHQQKERFITDYFELVTPAAEKSTMHRKEYFIKRQEIDNSTSARRVGLKRPDEPAEMLQAVDVQCWCR